MSDQTRTEQIKSLSELREELGLRQGLCTHYRDSFFNVISLFGPVISAAIVNRHMQRDALLTAEAHSAITTHGGIGANGRRTKLNTLLALQTILCTEYRNSYFAAINLVGVQVFDYVGDNPQQHDGIIEAEAARVDDLIEIIRCAAD